jgi:hypothetical protein
VKQNSNAFFKEVLKEVKAVKLSDVIGEYIDVKINSMSDNDALCPFHGDDKFGNFKINDNKNLYKCFSCDEYGDGIVFVEKTENVGFKEAVIRIAYMQDIISKTQSEQLLGGVLTSNEIKRIEKKKVKSDDSIVEKAPSNVLNSGFRSFMKATVLSEAHTLALMERGLSAEDIEAGEFFTFPEVNSDFLMTMYNGMKQARISSQILKYVPGFVTAEHLKQEQNGEVRYLYTFTNQTGLGIPIKNAVGEVVGIQVRKDTVKEGEQRFAWFSSSYAEHKNTYKHGTPAGAPLHVTYPKENKFKNVAFITEGIFKATAIANQFNATAVSLQGVGNFHTIVEELEAIQEENGTLEHIFIAFDADMAQNVHVYRHLRKMVEKIKEAFPEVKFYNSLWDEVNGKGIDDLMDAGKIDLLKRVDMDAFIEKYDVIIEELEVKHNEKIVKIPKAFIKEAFVQQVFTPLMNPTA